MKNKVRELKEFYNITKSICKKNYTLPILYFIKYQNGKLIYNNLDCLIEYKLSEKLFDVDCLIDIEKLSFFLKSPKSFTIDSIKNTEGYRIDDCPPNLKIKKNKLYKIDKLNEIIENLIPFISNDETRYYLGGICFDKNVVVSTNGHILAKTKIDCKFKNTFILPIFTCKIISNLKNLEFSYNKKSKRVLFKNDKIKIISKTIDGTYPDYKMLDKFLNGEIEMSLQVDDYEFLSGNKEIIHFTDNILRWNAKEYNLKFKHKMKGIYDGKYIKKLINLAKRYNLKTLSFKQKTKEEDCDGSPLTATIGNYEAILMPRAERRKI